jgi:hypothetical protein
MAMRPKNDDMAMLIGPLPHVHAEDANLTNYRNENQNSHKLQGRKPKFVQIIGTKFKIQKYKNLFSNSSSYTTPTLKVNFHKSKLFGINLEDGFLDVAAGFLKCRIGNFPFIYLGLPVGANPRRPSTWKPVIDVVKCRLSSWRNRYVSLGGRVVLIYSVLAAIPIFYLSFLKMPTSVWRSLVLYKETFFRVGLRSKTK